VDSRDILAFARRDWSRVADAKAEYWLSLKGGMTPTEILTLGDDLRRHARAVRPDWPAEVDRAEDLAVHARVAEALRAVSRRSR
jgi:hypothetical protein